MSDLFDFSPQAADFGVMGNPVSHSRSPQIHHQFGEQCGISLNYSRIQVDPGGFEQAVSHFQAHGGAGLNITVPFKLEAWQLCNNHPNQLSDRARLAQSVNTLKFQSDGAVFGDNTDGIGLVRDLQNNIALALEHKKILIIGAGGAVRGVLGPILDCDPTQITIANRTVEKANRLCETFGTKVNACGLSDTSPSGYDLVINGTSSSLQDTLPGVPDHAIHQGTTVYDMMYAPQPTIFMKWALDCGAQAAWDGLGMLVEQAAESFSIWHQQSPSSTPVIESLRNRPA